MEEKNVDRPMTGYLVDTPAAARPVRRAVPAADGCRVPALTLREGEVFASVEDGTRHTVRFRLFRGEAVSASCDCGAPGSCRHLLCVIRTLAGLAEELELYTASDLTAVEAD